jgi:Flp pilus assembly protein TadD
LQEDGELGAALTWLKQATELEPDSAVFWEHLAELHGEREASAEAIPCWERALAIEANRASAHNGMAWALQDEGRLAEAEDHFRTALRLQPGFAAAQMNLGGVYEERGDLSEAEGAFREALLLQPAFALPHTRLATLLRGKLPEADVVALQDRLADAKLAEGPRARLLFALAHVLDGRAEYARAAECLRQANALSLEHDRRRKREYQPAEHERFVTGVLDAFGREFFERMAGAGLRTKRPVFVFGLPRSGTTLIEQVLASHSRVHGAGELRLARQTFESLPGALGKAIAPLECVSQLTSEALQGVAKQHEDKLRLLAGPHAERVVDKMPDNYMYLGLLAGLFPDAVFIHCRRDVRDIAVSCWMTDFRSIRWAHKAEHIAARFNEYHRLMDHWRAVLPVAIHVVDYEQAVTDLEGVARRLIAACGLGWEPACLEFYRTRRSIRTASVTQVREPVYRRSVRRWKNYERELAELFALFSPNEGKAPHCEGEKRDGSMSDSPTCHRRSEPP